MTKKRIPIFFATDDNYFPYLTVTLASIEENADDNYIYDVKILTASLSEEARKTACKLTFPHISLSIVNVDEKMKRIRSHISKRLRDYYSESIFYRIFIPHLFPKLDKAVYLDCDIVLKDDIAKLYNTNIGESILGAVADESIAPVPEFCSYVKNIIGVPNGKYFNSGVLVINAKKFREEKIEEKLLHLIDEYNFRTVAPDQDYLNYLCKNKVYYYDMGWNKQPNQNLNFSEEKIHLIHYNMFNKPWHYKGVKYEEHFWHAAKSTPYYKMLLHQRESFSEADRISDYNGAQKLIKETVNIMKEKCSFCDIIGENYFENKSEA